MAGWHVDLEPGLGSRVQRRQPEEILRPWMTTPTVGLPVADYWAGIGANWNEELLQQLFVKLPLDDGQVGNEIEELLNKLHEILLDTTVEFDEALRTLGCWQDSMRDVAQQSTIERAGLIRAFFVVLGQKDLVRWLLPQQTREQLIPEKNWQELFEGELALHNGWSTVSPTTYWFKTMFIIHFFSGRRRDQDLQSFLEGVECPGGVYLTILSVDIIFGGGADMAQRHVQQRWLEMMALGYVLGFFAGPPCETYSVARQNEIEGINIRPVRSAMAPWGFASLSLREAAQVLIGNLLMLFVIQAATIQTMVGHFACIEHPAEPTGPHRDDAVSMWKLALTNQLFRHPAIHRCTVLQGRYGAPSPKPTTFLIAGPKDPSATLHGFASSHCSTGVSIGLEADSKKFQTSKLKEYPPQLCKALAAVLSQWIVEQDLQQCRVTESPMVWALQYVEAFNQALEVHGATVGPDYNPNARGI